MEKPDLKQVGLEIAEGMAKELLKKAVRPYAEYYINKSENKIDDILLPFLDDLEAELLEQLDKIDGVEGN